MTSRQCFVYLQLPLSLEVVTCGRYERESVPGIGAVGRFVYGRRYRSRADAVPLDPFGLPLTDRVQETALLDGIHGALRDAAPDYWGRLVIQRATSRTDLDEMDYLLYGPEDRAGALSFGTGVEPPPPRYPYNPIVQLADLLDAARRIEAGASPATLPAHLRALVAPGTSLGGARPKAVVEDGAGLWVAKFPMQADRWNVPLIEGAMLALARRCGIRTPPSRVERFGADAVLLVARFDREQVPGGYHRDRMLSGLTILEADDGGADLSRWSYLLLADELQRRSERAAEDKAELFRRMVFNALISNSDDHPRNHAIVARGSGWRLSPAYDLTPHPTASQERALALVAGLEGRAARRSNLLSGAGRFGLSGSEATAIVTGMQRLVASEWEGEVRRLHGSKADSDAVRAAFEYPGFDVMSAD
jgi:serine/threonine-protein kinase HipA